MYPPCHWQPRGLQRAGLEFLWFGIKEARSCLFVGLFFLAVFVVPRTGVLGLPRYDVLLLAALTIQIAMVAAKLETWDELKAISLFHLVGFAAVGRPAVFRLHVRGSGQLHHSGLAFV